jgi:Fe2+ transport system protein B
LYEHHSKEISEAFLHELRNDKILLNSFVERLTQKIIGKVATHARKKIVDTIASQIQQAASTQTAHAVAQNVSHLTSTAVGTQVAMYTATAVMKVFVTKIGPIVAKFLASAAFRKFITVMAHKLIVGVITSTVVHFLAAQIGAAIGAGAIIIPIVAAILIAQIHNFPEKLGTEVAISIRQHLERNFKPTNKNILEQVFNQIFRGEDLLKAVAQDEEVQKAMKN